MYLYRTYAYIYKQLFIQICRLSLYPIFATVFFFVYSYLGKNVRLMLFFHIYTANQHTRGCYLATLRCQLKWVGLIFTHKRYIRQKKCWLIAQATHRWVLWKNKNDDGDDTMSNRKMFLVVLYTYTF